MAQQENMERQRRRETGERLRYWRTRRQCSQAEVARAAGDRDDAAEAGHPSDPGDA